MAAGSLPSEAAGCGSGVECGRYRRRSRHGGAAEASVRSGRNRCVGVGESVRGRRRVGRIVRRLARTDLGSRVRDVWKLGFAISLALSLFEFVRSKQVSSCDVVLLSSKT